MATRSTDRPAPCPFGPSALGVYTFATHVDIDRATDEADVRRSFEVARASFSLNLTVEELDDFGPGLILDYERESRERVLVWSE